MIMTVGYAAFQTNLTINAKGKIIGQKEIIPSDLKSLVTTDGDGLYLDTFETNRYIYRGTNPDNYIQLDNDLYRIIAIEPDNTLKIIKEENLENMVYDPGYTTSIEGVTNAYSNVGTRYTSKSTDYCYMSGTFYGCNVWGNKTTMLDSNGNSITKLPKKDGDSTTYDLPEEEAYINTYLNNTYYTSLSEKIKNKITTHSFNVGLLIHQNDQTQTLSASISQEKAYTWKGKIGLINVTDYIRASTDESCVSIYASTQSSHPCKNGNFINEKTGWTINPCLFGNSANGYRVINGITTSNSIINLNEVHPVFYLSSDTKLGGSGTSDNPYTIIS